MNEDIRILVDLIEVLRIDRYHHEKDLETILNSSNMKYIDKMNQLKTILNNIALTDTSISLVEQLMENKEVKNESNI